MQLSLARQLLERNVLKKDMEVEILLDVIALGNMQTTPVNAHFMILDITSNENNIIFKGANVVDGRRKTFSNDDIIKIDGMDYARFASVYNISASGALTKTIGKRGRNNKKP